MIGTRTPSEQRPRVSLAITAAASALLLAAALVAVVTTNLQTSADIRKESEESHLLSEMQVSLTTIEDIVARWQFDSQDNPHPLDNPSFQGAVDEFDELSGELSTMIDAQEVTVVTGISDAFGRYVSVIADRSGNIDYSTLHSLEIELRSELLELLEEENDHLIESVAADRASENLLRWGLPLLLVIAVVVLGFVFRLQNHSRQLDEERRINEARNQFIASVSHELRTPLTPVVALSHEMRDRVAEFTPGEIGEFAATIAKESADVSAIVEDLLAAARIEIGQLAMSPQTVDLREAVESALAAFGEMSEVTVDVAGSVVADPGRLRQIVRNLIGNARRYGGPQVEVSSRLAGGQVILTVADSGSGIPADLQEWVFEPFASAHRIEGVPTSVGLGLTVSRNLATMMGGTLGYSYEDGWSRFSLTLPAAPST